MNNKDSKIIQFPTNKIIRHVKGSIEEHQKAQTKINDQLKTKEIKEYIEHKVDDIVMVLINQFIDMAIKTDKLTFIKDLAMLVDTLRGLLYRDFGIKHTSHSLIDMMVEIKQLTNGTNSATINYNKFIEKGKSTRPFNRDVKTELDDLSNGSSIFEPEDNLDK